MCVLLESAFVGNQVHEKVAAAWKVLHEPKNTALLERFWRLYRKHVEGVTSGSTAYTFLCHLQDVQPLAACCVGTHWIKPCASAHQTVL